MSTENPKSNFKFSLIRGKSTKKKKTYNVSYERPIGIDSLIKSETPVFVKIKEGWIERIGKYAALAAVVLAILMAIFDYKQSEIQDKTFKSFQRKLDSTFNIQLENAKEQHEKMIATLNQQQKLMKQQNDTSIQLLRIQADNLKTQNEIGKINQKNEILIERVKIAISPSLYFLKNDSLKFTLNYTNSGQRVAKNIKCQVGVLVNDQYNQISLLVDEEAPMSMNKIIPGQSVNWSIDKKFSGRIKDTIVYIYSSFSYEDEMFQDRFITSDFMRIFIKDGITNFSFCDQKQIDYIENHSHYRDIEIEDFTIRKEFLYK